MREQMIPKRPSQSTVRTVDWGVAPDPVNCFAAAFVSQGDAGGSLT